MHTAAARVKWRFNLCAICNNKGEVEKEGHTFLTTTVHIDRQTVMLIHEEVEIGNFLHPP